MRTWREMIDDAMYGDDNLDNMVWASPGFEEDLDTKFDSGYGVEEGSPFILWTKGYVYFPTEYDGSESVARVPRDPDESFKPRHF